MKEEKFKRIVIGGTVAAVVLLVFLIVFMIYQLVSVSQIIAKCGANVVGVHHEHANAGSEVIGCYLRIDLETRDFAQIEEINRSLRAAGFKLC